MTNSHLFLIFGAMAMTTMMMVAPACSQGDMPHASDVPDAAIDEVALSDSDAEDMMAAQVESQQSQDALPANAKQAVLAGGCFWCVEAVYEQIEGVYDVESGYIGGTADTANYSMVCSKATGHAEAVRITYDPDRVTFGQLLKVFFTVAHNPTHLNRQGNDHGPQYRSAIFPRSAEQRTIARAYIDQLNASGQYPRPIVTTIEDASVFYPAETYHQDYARNNPNDGYVRAVSRPKVEHLQDQLPEMLREDDE